MRPACRLPPQRTTTTPAAALPAGIDGLLTTSTLAAAGVCVLGSAALAVRAPPPQARPEPGSENTEYGIMGVVSCIPLVNWTAWILPALSNPERSSLYWSYSLLYCVPLLRNGFNIDGYVLAMLALGVLHVQAERIALTEPDTLRDIQPVRSLLQVTVFLIEKGADFTASLMGILAADSKRITQGRDGSLLDDASRPRDEERVEDSDEYLLKQFDRQILERSKQDERRKVGLPPSQQRLPQTRHKQEDGEDKR